MKTTIITATAAVALFGASSMAFANDLPPNAPPIYDAGPAANNVNKTDMREVERHAFALSEALMQSVESYIYVNGCDTNLKFPVSVYSQGGQRYLTADTLFGISLKATPQPALAGFGEHIDVTQDAGPAFISSKMVQGVRGRYTYNEVNNMMINERTTVQVESQNTRRGNPVFDTFTSSVIKDFYKGDTYLTTGDARILYDYGLQSLTKIGYPVNKWWQKSKAVRDNTQQACTVFVKDRLVGSSSCRITLATAGLSQPEVYDQAGYLKVETVTPGAASTELNQCGVNPVNWTLPPL